METPLPRTRLARTATLAAALALAACATHSPAPAASPATPPPALYAEPLPGWLAAAPADTLSRGDWWRLFGDPGLDALVPQVRVANQTLAADAAAVESAQAAVRLQRASFFPGLSLGVNANRSGSRAEPSAAGNQFQASLGASWESDLWGRVRANVSGAEARVAASEADLAAATLSAQGAFVVDYLGVREADAEIALVQRTVAAYRRALEITQHRYDAGLAPRTDVLQAQTQVATAEGQLAGLERQRAQLLHALAVLAGQAPAQFTLPAGEWASSTVPAIPVDVPSTLLQRRPDIAAAQRRVAAANADLGAARSAWFPALTLSASAGPSGPRLADLFDAKTIAWSLGVAASETVFDGGARSASIDAAHANWRQAVATYRQATLTALQAVEDQLASASTLERQEAAARTAAESATQTEAKQLSRYRQGQASYGDVVAAQIASLGAQRALLQASLSRQQAAVQLILAMGGGWRDDIGVLDAARAAAGR